ncbi:hypothetical protein QMZ64_13660 [Bacillus sp. LB7]|uniref:hypothetical protein n=1 Tax=Bacillus sp. LB7 TaxID=3043238 RepID=UPI00264783A8|nr:hypothetical protein [Bacillus sp. LB7]MDN5388468.1 hypothetical protein [Bacillus sp. LB7]
MSKRALKKEIEKADEVVAVLRGTHFSEELNAVLELIPPDARRVCFIVTFQDKMTDAMRRTLSEQVAKNSLPVLLVDTRTVTDDKKERIIAFLRKEAEFHPLKRRRMKQIELESVAVQQFVFHRPVVGPVVSTAFLCLLLWRRSYWLIIHQSGCSNTRTNGRLNRSKMRSVACRHG